MEGMGKLLIALAAVLVLGGGARAFEAECLDDDGSLEAYAEFFEGVMDDKLMPFYVDNVLDEDNGGYIVSYDVDGQVPTDTKNLLIHARMLFAFCEAKIKGFASEEDLLSAAKTGYDFITTKFFHQENGGYYWETDLSGNPTDTSKKLVGHGLVLYSFVHYHTVTEDDSVLDKALELFNLIEDKFSDPETGGRYEEMTADWQPNEQERSFSAQVLHLMEAYTALVNSLHTTEAVPVQKALTKLVTTTRQSYFPDDPTEIVSARNPDMSVKRSGSEQFGVALEFAWVLMDAQSVLGIDQDWDLFDAYMEHALDNGMTDSGGITDNSDIVWYAQAEFINAVVEERKQGRAGDTDALKKVVEFLVCNMVDRKDGYWVWSVNEDGSVADPTVLSQWKGGYHVVRSMTRFVDTF